ncbi:MAG: heparinase II/III family protein [Bacteroidota bacterium]
MIKNISATIFIILFISNISISQPYPSIHSSRPRIYIDSSRFAWLQTNISSGDCQATYNSFHNAVYSNWYNDPQLYLLGTDSTLWTWDFSSQWAAMQGQFVPSLFKITNDASELKRCRFLITQINNRYDTLNFANYDWYTNENFIRGLADFGGLLLDWCYDSLPPLMRQHLAQNLYKVDRYFMNTYITSNAGNSYVSSHNAWNTFFANQYSLVLFNADGLTALQQDTVLQWYHITYDKWMNGFNPCYSHFRDDDGGWNWGAAYSMWSLVDQFQLFENMRIATGKNFYTDLPWVQNSINQYWYFIQPDGWTINWGDGFTNEQGDRVIYRHAQIFNDPRSLWLAQYYSLPQNITWTWPIYLKLMYKDFNMPTVTKPDIAHDWWSDKVGLSVSRTGWDSSSALIWFFNSPTKKAAHEHRDNNSFCIYKNEPQIINSGYYYSYGDAHYTNYYMKTIAHNSICVYDSSEQYTNWGVNVSNDGGQNESPTLMNINDISSQQFQKGKWILWGSGNDYCYNIADAHQSYDSTKLDRFTRRLFFYKPDKVIVLDFVHLNQVGIKQRDAKWILHFQNEPTINGNLTNVSVPNHIESFDGKDILQTNGNGNVAIRTLLPLNTITTKIGGTGYEYFVDGINYPVAGAVDSIHTSPGKWRIEVAPTVATDSLVFLHTINIGDNNTPSAAGGVLHQNVVSIAVDWNTELFYFNAHGDTGVVHHLAENIQGGRILKIVAADLKPATNFDVLIDNVQTQIAATDTNGILETNISLASGNHSVEIVLHNTLIVELENSSDLISISPNPVNDYILISKIEKKERIQIQITDEKGNIVLQKIISDDLKLEIKNQTAGIYFIHAKSGNRTQLIRFVKS